MREPYCNNCNRILAINEDYKSQIERLETELSLAKQDRDSWKRTHKTTQDAANEIVGRLELDLKNTDSAWGMQKARLEADLADQVALVQEVAAERATLKLEIAKMQAENRNRKLNESEFELKERVTELHVDLLYWKGRHDRYKAALERADSVIESMDPAAFAVHMEVHHIVKQVLEGKNG